MDLAGESLPFLLDAECLIILKFLQLQLLLEFLLDDLLLLHHLFALTDLHGEPVLLGGASEAHVAATAPGDDGLGHLHHHGVHFDFRCGCQLAISVEMQLGRLVGGVENFIFAVRHRSDTQDQVLLVRVSLLRLVEASLDAELLAVVLDFLD